MTHFRLAAVLIAILISFQIYSATAVQAANWQAPTSVQRTINLPNHIKDKFTTNDDQLDSRLTRTARQRMARENRRNHNNRDQTNQNTGEDERTQGEDKLTESNQRQSRRQRTTNSNRLTRQGQGAQTANSQSGLND